MGCISSKSKSEFVSRQSVVEQRKFIEQSLKYSSRLLPLDVGHILTIIAKPLDNAENFNIFFESDSELKEDFEDIQFYIAVDFKRNVIARNSYTKGQGWAEQEIEHNIAPGNITNPNPIKRGVIFKIEIFIGAEMFHVSIDNKPFCIFKHRKPIKDIQRINVYGDIDRIYQISHMTPKQLSKAANDKTLINIIPSAKCGSVLSFSAMPQGAENGTFEINLTDDATRRVLFQLKANFKEKKMYAVSQNKEMMWSNAAILNPEEFPFNLNKMFKLAIGLTSHDFVVSTDGNFSMKFPHNGVLLNDSPLKIEVLSSDGMFMDIFGINNHSREEMGNSLQASFVYLADGAKMAQLNKDWSPKKSLERLYSHKTFQV